MKIVSMASVKGGVGRTTISANLASIMTEMGRKVLAVDLDSQNALRLHFNPDVELSGGWSRCLLEGHDTRDAILSTDSGLYYLPYGVLDAPEHAAMRARAAENPNFLLEMLQGIDLEDDVYVILDTPAGLNEYTDQFLRISDVSLLLIKPEMASYATFPTLRKLIEANCTSRAAFTGLQYVINGVNPSTQLSKDVARFMVSELGGAQIHQISDDVQFPQSFTFGKTAYEYDQNSQVSRQLVAVAESLLATME